MVSTCGRNVLVRLWDYSSETVAHCEKIPTVALRMGVLPDALSSKTLCGTPAAAQDVPVKTYLPAAILKAEAVKYETKFDCFWRSQQPGVDRFASSRGLSFCANPLQLTGYTH
jgi:hypothetical protein